MSKRNVRLFMVPIYIEVSPENDHEITLVGALGLMEDQGGGIWADTQNMYDCGRQRGKDAPKVFKS